MRRSWILRLLGLCSLLGASGCASLYRHAIETDEYSLYGDHEPKRLQEAGEFFERSIRAYRELLPRTQTRVPTLRVVYQEDRLSRQRIFTSEIRQEGYYVPLLRLIRLTPRSLDLDRGLGNTRKVILHELAHHFLIHGFEDSGSRYWLSEGLACAFEVSYFAEDELRVPLYHPWLHRQAQQRLRSLGPQRLAQELRELIDSGWLHFNHGGDRIQNYALSWAMTYFLLQEQTGPLEDRIDAVVRQSNEQVQTRVPEILDWLQGPPDQEVERLANTAEHQRWALDQWLRFKSIQAPRFLPHVLPSLSGPGASRRQALRHLAQLLNRAGVGGIGYHEFRQLQDRLLEELRASTSPEQLVILRELERVGCHSSYYAPLIAGLTDDVPEIRLESARALARVANKPTITRPTFWLEGSSEQHEREQREWLSWLQARTPIATRP